MAWELHVGVRTLIVEDGGEIVIGRASDADVTINDPLVSRRHAVVRCRADVLEIEDADSRQGVRVNGAGIVRRARLHDGDRIAICAHEIRVVDRSTGEARSARGSSRNRRTTLVSPTLGAHHGPTGATGQASPSAVLLDGAEDALARGDVAGCEFAFGRLKDLMTRLERDASADSALLRRYATCALRAAKVYGRASWIDDVIDVHAVQPRVMHAATADALEGALERFPRHDRGRLRSYVRVCQGLAGLGNYERFCLERLEGLVGRT